MKKNITFLLLSVISFASFGQSNLIITGVFDGSLTGGTPKGVELYVSNDIADLSIYGLGAANNGGGTDGEEFTFPNATASAGDFIYVASEATYFNIFFGFSPNYTSGAMAINGDDAIELFKNGVVVDVFGDINTDGSGKDWEYLNGWAYRVNKTAPDGSTFEVGNWTFSGINAFDNQTSNASAATPFPTASYAAAVAGIVENQIEGFALYPNPVTNRAFIISSANGVEKNIEIFSVNGELVYSKKVKSNQTIDISNLTTGLYLVKVEEEEKIATRKLIVK